MDESERGPASGKQKRRSGQRRKTGCYTCKARHASCDEKKPVCSNCERLNLDCRPFEFIVRSPWCPPKTTPTTVEAVLVEPGSGADDASTATQATPAHPAHSSSGTSVTNVGSGPQSSPSSSQQSPPDLASSVSPGSSAAASSHSAASSSLGPLSISPEVAHLLSVYSTGVATWMDVFDHGRSYQCEVPRRCLVSSLVTKCVCAFTAKQLSLLHSGEVWSTPATHYYGDALRLLIRHLNSNTPDARRNEALTANMLLSSYEMLEAHAHEHQRHLHGALALIRECGIDAQSTGMDRANFWIYVRHEITIALENETPLQFSPDEWNYDGPTGEVGEDVLGNHIIWLVARAVDLMYAPDRDLHILPKFEAILQEAASWHDNLPISFQGVKYGHPDDLGFRKTYFAVSTAAAAMMWYHLLHILLYAEATPHTLPCDPQETQAHAYQIADAALSELPPSVRAFSAQPLFFAAKHINGLGKKTKVWALLNDLESRYGFNTRRRIQHLQRLSESPA